MVIVMYIKKMVKNCLSFVVGIWVVSLVLICVVSIDVVVIVNNVGK